MASTTPSIPSNRSPVDLEKKVYGPQSFDNVESRHEGNILPTYSKSIAIASHLNTSKSSQNRFADDKASIELARKLQAEENAKLDRADVAQAHTDDASLALAMKLQEEDNVVHSIFKKEQGAITRDKLQNSLLPPPPAYNEMVSHKRNKDEMGTVDINCTNCGVLLRVSNNAKGVRCPKVNCGFVTLL